MGDDSGEWVRRRHDNSCAVRVSQRGCYWILFFHLCCEPLFLDEVIPFNRLLLLMGNLHRYMGSVARQPQYIV